MWNPSSVYEKFFEVHTRWAEADAEARRMDELRKVMHAEIMQRSTKKTVAEREAAATTNSEYIEVTRKANEARTQANVLKGKLKAIELSVDVYRTMESTKRAEMKLT